MLRWLKRNAPVVLSFIAFFMIYASGSNAIDRAGIDNEKKWELQVQALALLGGAMAFVIGYSQFTNAQRQRRAEWIDGLARRFFEEDRHRKIRSILDYGAITPEFDALRNAVQEPKTEEDVKLAEALVDYLNFFEHVAALEKTGQVELSEIDDMFGYYVRLVKKHDFVDSFVKDKRHSFEQLKQLITSLETLAEGTAR